MRARASVGFPPGDRWAHEGEPGVQVMLTLGEPHKTLMARATAHALSELDRIDATAYRAVHADQRREELIASAETAIASLPEIERLALRSRLGWSADPKPTEGRQ